MDTTCGQRRSLLTWGLLADVRSEFIAACASVIALVAALGLPASAQEAVTPVAARARLTGVVFDSIGTRPLAGATVRLVLSTDRTTGRTATTGSDGGFVHDSVPAGTWLATFLHPVLDSLGLEPPLVRIDVRDAGEVALTLAVPSAATLITARCGPQRDADLGLLHGVVRSARDESPVAGASLALEWPEWVIRKRGLRLEPHRETATADSGGRFVVCGAPANSTVRVVAWSGSDSTGMIAVDIPPSGLARHDFAVATAERVVLQLAADSADAARVRDGARALMRRGRAMVQGRVVGENGRPVSGATIRVMGSGESASSDEAGDFVMAWTVAGTQTLEVRAIGFQPARRTVELRDEQTTRIALTLDSRKVLLDTVRVIAGRAIDPEVGSFERRWRSGTGGVFMDERTVQNRKTIFLTDALRALNGVRIVPVGGYGQRIVMRNSAGRECSATIFVDGMRSDLAAGSVAEMFLDDSVLPTDVAAIEVYARSAIAPAQFLNVGACGVVAVWTHSRFGGVVPRDPRNR